MHLWMKMIIQMNAYQQNLLQSTALHILRGYQSR